MAISPDDQKGLALSLGVHVLLVLALVLVAATPSEILEEDQVKLVELDFEQAPIVAATPIPVETGEPQRAVAGVSSAPSQSLDEPRPAPPAATPVRIPEAQRPTPPRPNPITRPTPSPTSRTQRPSPPSPATRPEPSPTPPRQPDPTEGRGNTSGDASTDGAGEGDGNGSGGDAPAEVGFQFGNRNYNCPQPSIGGLSGTIQFDITFAPNGRYVSGRPRDRNATLEQAVRRFISGCRAERLPANATQTNQSTNVTFRFVTD